MARVRRLAALVVLSGCGRLQFDPLPLPSDAPGADPDSKAMACVAVGHDEDNDGVDDACDVCPQRVDDGLDGDGDGVGDTCDLSALQQVRTLFDPFTSVRSEWNPYPGVIMGDVLRYADASGGSVMTLVDPPARDTFELTGVLLGAIAPNQISLQMDRLGPGSYYCEIYDDGNVAQLQLTTTPDGNTYTTIDTAPLPSRFDAGPFRIILDHTPPTTTCIADWDGMRIIASGTNPAIIPDRMLVGINQLDVELTSFVRLRTP
jgi:hypothetical protein